MYVSEVTVDTVKSWGRIEIDEDDSFIDAMILPAAKARICEYTGLSMEELDSSESLAMALVALCVFLYDNRSMNITNDKQNEVIHSFLDAHRVNLL